MCAGESMQNESEMNMRLIGSPTLKNVLSSMVGTYSLGSHVVPVPGDRLYDD